MCYNHTKKDSTQTFIILINFHEDLKTKTKLQTDVEIWRIEYSKNEKLRETETDRLAHPWLSFAPYLLPLVPHCLFYTVSFLGVRTQVYIPSASV